MRILRVYMHGKPAGDLRQLDTSRYEFIYDADYAGVAVSRTMPVSARPFSFVGFPSFFDGLLPEGVQLDQLLRQRKIDASDKMSQLAAVGEDLVGAVTVLDPCL
ncbi:MAG: hypothetical protein RL095_4182 [Verrucomicrobiota bacterium]|jgi:serine/threonine-protein kinase HipA